MKNVIHLLLLFCLALAGCVSKSASQDKERAAYFAGRQAAMAQMEQQLQQQVAGPHVTFVGAVRNPVLVWSQGLTLARAIVEAAYYNPKDPTDVIVHRNGREIEFAPQRLLNGEDMPLEAGDIVEVRQ